MITTIVLHCQNITSFTDFYFIDHLSLQYIITFNGSELKLWKKAFLAFKGRKLDEAFKDFTTLIIVLIVLYTWVQLSSQIRGANLVRLS